MIIDDGKLSVAMANEGILYKDLCQKAGIHEVTLRQIRKGTRNPKPSTVGKIAKALNVDVRDLIQEEGE